MKSKSHLLRCCLCAMAGLLVIVAFACCKDKKHSRSQEDGKDKSARQETNIHHVDQDDHKSVQTVVQKSCDDFMRGDYEAYVSAIYDSDSMNTTYRHQMVDLMAQFGREQSQKEGGLKSSTVVGDTLLSHCEAIAYVQYQYASDSVERVAVPVVKVNGEWRLR